MHRVSQGLSPIELWTPAAILVAATPPPTQGAARSCHQGNGPTEDGSRYPGRRIAVTFPGITSSGEEEDQEEDVLETIFMVEILCGRDGGEVVCCLNIEGVQALIYQLHQVN